MSKLQAEKHILAVARFGGKDVPPNRKGAPQGCVWLVQEGRATHSQQHFGRQTTTIQQE